MSLIRQELVLEQVCRARRALSSQGLDGRRTIGSALSRDRKRGQFDRATTKTVEEYR